MLCLSVRLNKGGLTIHGYGWLFSWISGGNKHNQTVSAVSASDVPMAAVELTLSDSFLCGLLKIIRILPAKRKKNVYTQPESITNM